MADRDQDVRERRARTGDVDYEDDEIVRVTPRIRRRNPRSTAAIFGHPIHPMLIPFPIAFFVATLVCDLVLWGGGNDEWFHATLWLLGIGLIIAAVAALAGLTDVIGEAKIRGLSAAWWHAGGNVIVVLLELWNWIDRYAEGRAAVLPTGLVLSVIVVLLLLFTGWMGWEMVYRSRVGVADEV